MNNETKFEVGDIVEWCGVLGNVILCDKDTLYCSFYNKFNGNIKEQKFTLDGRYEQWHSEPSLKLISKAKKKRKVKLYAYLHEVRNCSGDEPKYFEQLSYITVKIPGKRVPELDKEVEIKE